MNVSIRKLLSFDRTTLTLVILIIAALLFVIVSFAYTGKSRSANAALRTQISEMQSLSQGVVTLRNLVESRERKISLSKTSGVVSAMEQILEILGLEANVIKPLEKKKVNGFMEENAEIEIGSTDLNSIVNFLYKIETSPVPLKIKSTTMKTTFENPDRFILQLTVSLLSKA
jgi:hypothetical protein